MRSTLCEMKCKHDYEECFNENAIERSHNKK